MKMFYVAALLLAALTGGQSVMLTLENTTYVNIMLNGKMEASKQMNMSVDTNKLSLEFQPLVEKNDAGTETAKMVVGDKNFTLTAPADATNPGPASKQVTGTMADVSSGTLMLTVDVYTAGGNVTIDGETTVVMKGDVRVRTKLTGYAFNENSTVLELSLMVKGKKSPTAATDTTTDGMSYDLGGKGMVKFSKKEMIGSDYESVEPMVQGTMATIKFNKTVTSPLEYTFFLKLADFAVVTPTPTPGSSSQVTSLSVLVALMAMVAMLW